MSKKISKAFLRIIIIILAILVSGGALFVLTRQKYIFDFEGRVKLLEQIAKTQKKYPNATVLIPDESTQLPNTVPSELSYPNSSVVSVEQLASTGISYVLISSDSKDEINKTMSKAIDDAGWDLISQSEDAIEAKKGIQKTKISLEKEEDLTVIIVAYAYDL